MKWFRLNELPTKTYLHSCEEDMKVTEQTYSYYFTREFFPPLIIFILCVALTLLLIPVQLMLNRSPKLKRHFKTQFLIKYFFSTMLNKHTDRAGKNFYTILNYKVPERYKVLMLALVLSLIGFVGVNFWDIYLYEDSHICNTDPQLACFPVYPNMSTPRLDCSDTSYLEDNNITSVICYRYAPRLGIAIGSVLGIITACALFIAIYTLLLLKVSNGSGWNKRRALITVALQITTVATSLGVVINTIFFPGSNYYTNEKRIIKVLTIVYLNYTIIYCAVLFPWWSFKNIKDDENDNKKDDKDNDEDNGEYRRVRGTSIPI